MLPGGGPTVFCCQPALTTYPTSSQELTVCLPAAPSPVPGKLLACFHGVVVVPEVLLTSPMERLVAPITTTSVAASASRRWRRCCSGRRPSITLPRSLSLSAAAEIVPASSGFSATISFRSWSKRGSAERASMSIEPIGSALVRAWKLVISCLLGHRYRSRSSAHGLWGGIATFHPCS